MLKVLGFGGSSLVHLPRLAEQCSVLAQACGKPLSELCLRCLEELDQSFGHTNQLLSFPFLHQLHQDRVSLVRKVGHIGVQIGKGSAVGAAVASRGVHGHDHGLLCLAQGRQHCCKIGDHRGAFHGVGWM